MPAETDVPASLDPEIVEVLSQYPLDLGTLSLETLTAMRAGMGATPMPPLSDQVERTDHQIPGREGVSVRVHRPKGMAGPLPCLYWMHGGGMILGSNVMDDARFDAWCPQMGFVGVSVEYRLAPEFPYPVPMEDCYAGLRFTRDNAATLGIDPGRIGIGGASAGGGLAAGLGLLARDRGEIPVAFQLLIYPMIDDRFVTPSSAWRDPIWPPKANHFGWSSYLGPLYGTDEVPIYAAPARATDLSGLPPTLVTVGATDGFSDEDIHYAVKLRHAGVGTDLRVYAGAPHGFDSLAAKSAVATRARLDMEQWLAAQLRNTAAGNTAAGNTALGNTAR